MLALGLVIIFGLLFLGVPLFVCFVTGGTVLNTFYAGAPLANVAHMMFSALDSYVLMAVPFFILAGMLMGKGGLSTKIHHLIKNFKFRVIGDAGQPGNTILRWHQRACFSLRRPPKVPGSIADPQKGRVSLLGSCLTTTVYVINSLSSEVRVA